MEHGRNTAAFEVDSVSRAQVEVAEPRRWLTTAASRESRSETNDEGRSEKTMKEKKLDEATPTVTKTQSEQTRVCIRLKGVYRT
jgi:hypothetical protein